MSNKFRNLLIIFITLLSLFPLLMSISLAEFLVIDGAIFFVVFSVVVFVLGFIVAICIDYHFVIYKCRKCGHEFKPTFKAYLWSVHTVTTRYLKCPKCEEKSWCKIAEGEQKRL